MRGGLIHGQSFVLVINNSVINRKNSINYTLIIVIITLIIIMINIVSYNDNVFKYRSLLY
jgi:uncharacterized integral membrane protein